MAQIIIGKKSKIHEYPFKDEVHDMADFIVAHHVEPCVLGQLTISYYTGMRPGRTELLGLTWDQIDLKAKTIFIVSAKNKGPRTRTLPLHPDFYEAL